MEKAILLGYLRLCADRRFVAPTLKVFEDQTGLTLVDQNYWLESSAGGTAGHHDWITADHAYNHGSRIMGWQSHLNSCGRFPEQDDQYIINAHNKTLGKVIVRYPDATHYSLLASLNEDRIPVFTIELLNKENR